MLKRFLRIVSYILVAAIASFATLCLVGYDQQSYSKLEELESLIERYFIDEYDMALLEDAAAEEMVAALGDRWSYYMTAQEYLIYREKWPMPM